jgi:outer membrane protein assembly factor BamA
MPLHSHCYRLPLIAFFLLALTVNDLRGQPIDSIQTSDRSTLRIDTILVFGNRKTKDFVILDEMTLRKGMVVTSDAIEYDRSRIYSLGLFTRVDIDYQKLDTTGVLVVDVNERWYLIPIPLFGFRDGDLKRIFFGAGFLHNNFRGVNQKLFASFTLGYDPSVNVQFYDPLLDPDSRLYFGIGAGTAKVRNRSAIEAAITGDFDESHHDINVLLGKRLDLNERTGVRIGYSVVQVSSYRPGRTVSPDGRDDFLYCTIDYTFDSRDLAEYASNGAFTSLNVTKIGFGESRVSYARYGADFRHYFPLPMGLTFATRAYGSVVSGGEVPTYAHSYIGFGERLRGYYTTVFEGEDIAGATLELRFPLLRQLTIDVTALPIPEEFAIWRFGINLALFADAGSTWYRGDRVKLWSFNSGYGAGFHFLLPYGLGARVEYARNNYGRGEFILDLRGSI